MKSAKQNTILQSTDQHRITLVKTTIHYYSLSTQQRTRRADDGYKNKIKKTERHLLLIKLDPASK